jgi:1-acyl-sn-glycerol-3-phosphate acyltransferase
VNRENRVQAARSFLKIDRAIKEGWSIAIFPEGGIPDIQRPRMLEFKSGAFKLAMENKKCILPISFLSNYHLISDPSDVFGSAHPGFANTVVHPLVCYDAYKNWTEDDLKQKIFDTINQPLLELL